jgi:beta-phosphoglucomutase-like phosphatase (HAD superfamily)
MLAQVVDDVAGRSARGQLPVVVFDLDSTLFSTQPRNLRILREFAAAHGERWPEVRRVAADLTAEDMGWSLANDARSGGLDREEALAALGEFWRERFFTDAYVTSDEPAPGAVEYVRAVHAAGGFVYYLTGRHIHGMGEGTVRALTAAGFPLWRGRTALHLKPTWEMGDRAFKDQALADIRSLHGPVVATFENEPENANLFVAAFPEALHFWIQTVHSPKAVEPHPALIRFTDFHR